MENDIKEILNNIIEDVEEQSYLSYDDNPRRVIDEEEVKQIVISYIEERRQ